MTSPTPGASSSAPAQRSVRTVVDAWGEEAFKESGLPDEARTLSVEDAVKLGAKLAVEQHFEIPPGATGNLTAEEITEVVGMLQQFGAWSEIGNKEFWKANNERGFDQALAPHVRNKLGLPDGVLEGASASKIFEDSGEMQSLGLSFGDLQHWQQFGEFQAGKLSRQQLIDLANKGGGKTNDGNGQLGGQPGSAPRGSPDTGPATGNPNNPPGADRNPGSTTRGAPGQESGNQSNPAGKQKDSSNTPPGSSAAAGGSDGGDDIMQGDTIVSDAGESYHSVITHNEDGSFTVDVYSTDSSGNATKVNSETYTDTNGDGVYEGSNGGSSSGKPAEGSGDAQQSEDGSSYSWSAEGSDSSTDAGETDSDAQSDGGDTGSSDTEPPPDDQYTPGPDGGAHFNYEWMLAMYESLTREKFAAGKGGKDSTPNPMADSTGNGAYWWNPKDSVVRPIDGTSKSTANIPAEALQQLQNPNGIQGGVIDPAKNKDR